MPGPVRIRVAYGTFHIAHRGARQASRGPLFPRIRQSGTASASLSLVRQDLETADPGTLGRLGAPEAKVEAHPRVAGPQGGGGQAELTRQAPQELLTPCLAGRVDSRSAPLSPAGPTTYSDEKSVVDLSVKLTLSGLLTDALSVAFRAGVYVTVMAVVVLVTGLSAVNLMV